MDLQVACRPGEKVSRKSAPDRREKHFVKVGPSHMEQSSERLAYEHAGLLRSRNAALLISNSDAMSMRSDNIAALMANRLTLVVRRQSLQSILVHMPIKDCGK